MLGGSSWGRLRRPCSVCLTRCLVGGCVTLQQDEVVASLLSQLSAVEVEDLPGLVKYVVGAARSNNAEQVSTRLQIDRLCRLHVSAHQPFFGLSVAALGGCAASACRGHCGFVPDSMVALRQGCVDTALLSPPAAGAAAACR